MMLTTFDGGGSAVGLAIFGGRFFFLLTELEVAQAAYRQLDTKKV